MDLGKMLAEALRNNCDSTFNGNPIKWDHNDIGRRRIDGAVDLDAAAESFLTKVREAEKAADNHSGVFYLNTGIAKNFGADHTGPVPYRGKVE